MFEMSGTSMPNACLVAKKWFINGRRPDWMAACVAPLMAVGRSGRQEKPERLVTSKGFSKIKLNSSRRYGATVLVAESKDATNVIRRVDLAINSSSVGHVVMAVVVEGGV